MIEKIESLIAVAKQLSSLEYMLKALIGLAVLVCLYEYDQDNLINFRQCLMGKEWIEASLPLINLLLTLTNWLYPIVGMLFVACLFAKCLARGYITWIKIFCHIMKISFILSCSVLLIIAVRRVLLDDVMIHNIVLPISDHVEVWVPILFCVGIYIESNMHFEYLLSKRRENPPAQ